MKSERNSDGSRTCGNAMVDPPCKRGIHAQQHFVQACLRPLFASPLSDYLSLHVGDPGDPPSRPSCMPEFLQREPKRGVQLQDKSQHIALSLCLTNPSNSGALSTFLLSNKCQAHKCQCDSATGQQTDGHLGHVHESG